MKLLFGSEAAPGVAAAPPPPLRSAIVNFATGAADEFDEVVFEFDAVSCTAGPTGTDDNNGLEEPGVVSVPGCPAFPGVDSEAEPKLPELLPALTGAELSRKSSGVLDATPPTVMTGIGLARAPLPFESCDEEPPPRSGFDQEDADSGTAELTGSVPAESIGAK